MIFVNKYILDETFKEIFGENWENELINLSKSDFLTEFLQVLIKKASSYNPRGIKDKTVQDLAIYLKEKECPISDLVSFVDLINTNNIPQFPNGKQTPLKEIKNMNWKLFFKDMPDSNVKALNTFIESLINNEA